MIESAFIKACLTYEVKNTHLVDRGDFCRIQRVEFTRFAVTFDEITGNLTHVFHGKFLFRHTGEEREEQEGKDSIFHVITSLFEVKHMG